MSVRIIQDRLNGYGCRSTLEEEQALREITQEIILAGLSRTDFFRHGAFQGGTCLRVFHGLNRFSEDLDFALEVDTNPPGGARFETKYLDFPFPSAIRVFDLPSLFAGKVHALLCREYVKGRDWYDFIWYTGRRTRLNYELLGSSLEQMGPWRGQGLQVDRPWCVERLRAKIEATDWLRTREDVRRFVKASELASLGLWGREFFLGQVDKLV